MAEKDAFENRARTDPAARAETLSGEQFKKLADALAAGTRGAAVIPSPSKGEGLTRRRRTNKPNSPLRRHACPPYGVPFVQFV